MLSIPVRTISQGAVQVNAELSPADAIWTENDVRPAEGVRVTGRLNGAGAGRFYFSGGLHGIAA
jgi:hypothetical protein